MTAPVRLPHCVVLLALQGSCYGPNRGPILSRRNPLEIIDHDLINKLLDETKEAAKDRDRVREILKNARCPFFVLRPPPLP